MTDNEVYNRIIEDIDISSYPLYLESKAKRDCWIKGLKFIKNFFYKYYRVLRICIYKQLKKVKRLIRILKLKIQINNKTNETDKHIQK